MALGTQPASIGGAAKTLIVALDPNNNLAAAHVNVNASGVEVGTPASPLSVSVSNQPATQAITAASLPLPAGAATSANQPALNPDGGALTHVMNFPATQPISATSLPLPAGAATSANQPALNADGGALAHVMNFPTTQPVSATSLPLPAGAATSSNQPALNADGGALAHVMNFPTTQPISAAILPLPTGAAQDGTDATGVAAPSGGSGIRGWLSGIYAKISGTLSVSLATALPVGSNTIGAVTGAGAFTMVGQGASGAAPVGPPVAISGIDAGGLKQHLRTDTFGTPADPAWSSGSGSLVSLAKALVAAQQATTAAVTGSSLVLPSPSFTQTTALASSLVLKAAPGSLYACYVTTGSTAGWLMLFDAAAAPANGAVLPKDCVYCPANATTEIELPFLTPEPFATGITAAFSSTGPFTLTASATAFIKGMVQ